MQLGARWRCGEPPHRSVPSELHPIIAEHEAANPGAEAWTLTWLEGRPRLALDDQPLELNDDEEDDNDDWLA